MNIKILIVVAIIIIAAIAGCVDKEGTVKQSDGDKKINQDTKVDQNKKEDQNTENKEKTVVKVAGYLGTGGLRTNDPPRMAEELGYLKNIKIEEYDITVGPETLQAVTSGQVDAAHVPYVTIIRAIQKGVKVKVVASAHGVKTSNFDIFVLNDSTIKDAKDLKGKKIGGVRKGNTAYFVLIEYLKAGGLTINDVELIDIPIGQEEQILKSKQVDAIGVYGDFRSGAMKNAGYRILVSQFNVLPKDTHHCGLVVSEKFIRERPEILKEFVDGFVKASDWERENPDKAKEYMIKFAKELTPNVEPLEKFFTPNDIREHALVKDPDIQWFIDRLIDYGELKPGQIKPSDVYTNEFNPYTEGKEKLESKTDNSNKEVIKVAGYLGNGGLTTNNPPRLAQELGYFKTIKTEDVDIPIGPEAIAALTTGQIDAAHVPYLTIARAIAKGVKVKAVASAHGSASTSGFDFYVLNDSGISSAKDLKGKKVGGVIKGGSSYFVLVKYLESGGLTINDVESVTIPTGQEEQVLRSKQVDVVAIVYDIGRGVIAEHGGAKLLFSQYDILPKDTIHCGLVVSEKFIQERPELLKEFVDGFVKAADWERDNHNQSVEYYKKFAKEDGYSPDLIRYKLPSDIRQHALIIHSDPGWFIDRLIETGELKEGQIKHTDIFTNEFNPYFKEK